MGFSPSFGLPRSEGLGVEEITIREVELFEEETRPPIQPFDPEPAVVEEAPGEVALASNEHRSTQQEGDVVASGVDERS